jgi:hypothetical protein
LSSLAKSASGKLKSDINKMASYFKLLGSEGSAVNVGKYLQSHPSALKDYSSAARTSRPDHPVRYDYVVTVL